MIEGHQTHWQIVEDSIIGERAVDERTFASAAVLAERMSQLKRHYKGFEGVAFSPEVRKLTRQDSTVAIG